MSKHRSRRRKRQSHELPSADSTPGASNARHKQSSSPPSRSRAGEKRSALTNQSSTRLGIARFHALLKPLLPSTQLVDGASLAVFRITFGLMMAWDVVPYFQREWIELKYLQPAFHFPYVSWIQPLPGYGLHIVFGVICLSGIFVALGLFYRISAIVLFLTFTYVALLDRTEYLNHFYLMGLLSFICCLIPAHRIWSLDRRLGWVKGPPLVPYWSIHLVRFQIVIVYFFAGLAKIQADWLSGSPIFIMLKSATDVPWIANISDHPSLAIMMAWGGMLFDLLIGFFLLWRRTRLIAIIPVIAFHVTNAFWFKIGVFPWLMIASTPIFFDPSWPRLLVAKLLASPEPASLHVPDDAWRKRLSPKTIRWFLLGFVALQLLLPLRHYLIPGDAEWTVEGHYFAWRMKLHTKSAKIAFRVTLPASGRVVTPDVTEDIRIRQWRRMQMDPYLIRQYAIYLSRKFAEDGRPAKVQVLALVGLNGREQQPVIDPKIDLASTQTPTFPGSANWIMPLTKPRVSPQKLSRQRIQP